MTPTPQGDITSTETWDETPAEVVEEISDDPEDTEQV